jgi:anaerobic selenocysteine-containing dehydrogenase
VNRRDFLNLSVITGAGVALAGCGRPAEPAFISQAQMPEFYLPGIGQYFATTCSECSAGCGIAVKIIGGRAKKIEGIETHPLSRGGHCLRSETTLQALYNPDRLKQPWKRAGNDQQPQQSWDEALKALAASFDQPGGLWITGPLTGTLGAMIVGAARASGAKIWVIDTSGTTAERAAMKAAGGPARLPWYSIADADYVVNFGSDFLSSSHPNNVEYNWQYGQFRNGKGRTRRGILVSFASRMNMTVSNSDRWVPVNPGTEGLIARAVTELLGEAKAAKGGKRASSPIATQAAQAAGIDEDLIHRLAERLAAARKAVAIGGAENTAYSNGVSAMAAILELNKALAGNKVQTYETDMLVAPKGMTVAAPADLLITTKQALDGLKAGTFTTIWVNDVNPAYLYPQNSLGVAAALQKAHTFALTPFFDETSILAEWLLPTTTMLEQWADVRVDGPYPVYGIQQPVVTPVPGTKPLGDLLLAGFAASTKLKGMVPLDSKKQPVTSLRDVMMTSMTAPQWARALERGGVYKDASLEWSPYPSQVNYPGTPGPATTTTMPAATAMWEGMKAAGAAAAGPAKFSGAGKFVLIPYLSPTLGDGSYTNRPWALEIPDPMAQAVWTSWVELNPEDARQLGVKRMEMVEVSSDNGEKATLPCLPTPTVVPGTVAIPMGMGHTSFGRYAFAKGYNPLNLVTPTFQDGTDELVRAGTKVNIRKTGQQGWVTTYDWRAGDMPRALYED